MSTIKDDDLHEGGDDILAAEFALGVLPAADQTLLARRVETDPEFARAVSAWEERLSPLAEGYMPADVSPRLKTALDKHLFGIAGTPAPSGFWSNLKLWRGLAAGVTAAFLVAVTLPMMQTPLAPQASVMASLSTDTSDVHYMAVFDAATGMVRLAHLAGNPAPGQVFELWVAEGDAAPVSLGVIPAGPSARIPMDDTLRTLVNNRAHMAISLEPPGGSPTGQPTGDVVALGDLLEI
jgi:anti-sigma-K factor RskA